MNIYSSNIEGRNYTYSLKCKAISVMSDSSLSTHEDVEINLADLNRVWKFITCGVSLGDKLLYAAHTNNRNSKVVSFESDFDEIPTLNNVTFKLTENSPNGYGVTFIKELRLWECYDCCLGKKNFQYSSGDINFISCLHCFRGDNNYFTSIYPIFEDVIYPENKVELTSVPNFQGYNILQSYSTYLICNEDVFQYLYNDKCQTLFNLNRANDFEVISYSSRTGRYTMEFWFYIEKVAEMANGINFIWDNHLSLSLITSQSQSSILNAVCFPQAYRDKVDDKTSGEIYNLYNNAINKDIYEFYNADDSWQYVRCAVDHTRKIYRISSSVEYDNSGNIIKENANLEKTLEAEILFGNTRNVRPFRFFGLKELSTVKFQNFKNNGSRQFLRQFKLFREYIDFRIGEIKDIDWYNNLKSSWLISLLIDFEQYTGSFTSINIYNKTCKTTSVCGIYYTYNDPENNRKVGYIKDIFHNSSLLVYTSYPAIYKLNLCSPSQKRDHSKNQCTGTKVNDYDYYYRNNVNVFYPINNNNVINLDTIKQVSSCQSNCVLPEFHDNKRGYCLMEMNDDNHIKKCSKKSTNDIYESFECEDNYQRVYYECIHKNLVKGSALYFSNYYSFPNLKFTSIFNYANDADNYFTETNNLGNEVIAHTEQRITSYYLEFWFKLDYLNDPVNLTQNQYYFYGYPHTILRNSSDNSFKYSNLEISNGAYHYPLTTINSYEWNRIIIENKFIGENKKFSIKVYINYDFINPAVDILVDAERGKMHFKGIVFCNGGSDCQINGNIINIQWGIAWYKNIRVWKGETTSLQLIQSCDYIYSELVKSMKYYFPFTVDYIYKDTVKGKIDDFKFELKFWFHNKVYNYDFRENYSGEEMDYSGLNENTFISGTNEDNSNYVLTECYENCKRCYSIAANACYECRTGYILYGRSCKRSTGFYFKVPPENTVINSIKLNTETSTFSLSNTNPITITFWMKYMGVEYSKTTTSNYFPIIYFCDQVTFLGFKPNENFLSLVINNIEAYDIEIADIMGNWVHIGLSSHASSILSPNTNSYFPHMFNFMINYKIMTNMNLFNIQNTPVYFNTFTFDTRVVSFFSNIRFYNNFWFGTFGHVTATDQLRSRDLIYEIVLNANTKENCIKDTELDSINTFAQVSPLCVIDYLPYEDLNIKCTSDSLFFDIEKIDNIPCSYCNKICRENCFGENSNQCSCNYKDGLYWIKADDDLKEFKCEEVNNINLAFFEQITLESKKVSPNKEMMISFWFNIYQYKYGSFDSLDIIWDRHLKVSIKGKQTNQNEIKVECIPDINISGSIVSTYSLSSNSFTYGNWFYVRCGADKYRKKFKLDNVETNFIPVNYDDEQSTSTIIINDNTINFNYGYSFIKEIKFYASYNYDFWKEEHYLLTPSKYDYLLHYYSFNFDYDSNGEKSLDKVSIIDKVTENEYFLIAKNNRIGYNYIKNYQDIIFCNEGYLYNSASKECELYSSFNCQIAHSSSDKCLICKTPNKYLKIDDLCYSDCSPNFYNDEYLNQCRQCDDTCYTCSGKYENNCLSCIGSYYLVESKNLCVLNCEAYNLTAQIDIPNLCGPFKAHANITFPIFLPDGYDYDNYETNIIIDVDNFDTLSVLVYNETAKPVTVEWIYSVDESRSLNYEERNRNYNGVDDIPENHSLIFTSSSVDGNIFNFNVDKSYFRHGLKYIFYLKIIKTNDYDQADYHLKYILIMNDYPIVNKLNILPQKGFISTNFLFTCNECTDDNTPKEDLEYKFTYELEGSTEKLIRDWDLDSEVLYIFKEEIPNNINYNQYTIKCYCKDKFSLYDSTSEILLVNKPPTESGVSIPISEVISSIDVELDLSSKQLSNRAEFISTITVDFPKEFILNRTNVTNYDININDKIVTLPYLILQDPISLERDSFCNKRGNSYMIYKYLYCDCSDDFVGVVCQIDKDSLSNVLSNYKTLYQKVLSAQTTQYDFYLLNTVHLLIKSGAAFMPLESTEYMLQAIEYIVLYTNKFVDVMTYDRNYEVYFDIYNSLIEYGVYISNLIKGNVFKDNNFKENDGLYNKDLFRNASLDPYEDILSMAQILDYFDRIKQGLTNLMKFYASKKKELSFQNKNINVYIAIVNENFEFSKYFKKEKELYEPYFDISNCLSSVMERASGGAGTTFKTILLSIMWKIPPYLSDNSLFWNNTSPLITIELIDYYTLKQIYLNDCGEESEIKLYFPISHYLMTPRINEKKKYVAPKNQYSMTGSMFNDPVYIAPNGKVDNSTTKERQKDYFINFNLSCKSYILETEPKRKYNLNLDYSILDYVNFTDDNYAVCYRKNLLHSDFSEFVLEHYDVKGVFKVNTRFFYLIHFELYKYGPNYKGNYGLFIFIFLIVFYFLMIFIYKIIEKFIMKKLQLLNFLNMCILKINLPYLGTYNVKSDLNLSNEIKNILKTNDKTKDKDFNPEKPKIDVHEELDVINFSHKITREKNVFGRNKINNNFMDKVTGEDLTTIVGENYSKKKASKKGSFYTQFNKKEENNSSEHSDEDDKHYKIDSLPSSNNFFDIEKNKRRKSKGTNSEENESKKKGFFDPNPPKKISSKKEKSDSNYDISNEDDDDYEYDDYESQDYPKKKRIKDKKFDSYDEE